VIYLTGCDVAGAPAAGLGLMSQPATYRREIVERYRWWAADNGCFAAGDEFDEEGWWRWLRSLRWATQGWCRATRTFCLFAAAPDVVGDPVATYRRSWKALYHIRCHGFPSALVAQDGLEAWPFVRTAGFWDELDCLFLGGSTEWKLGAGAAWLAGEALARRKWVHMGRVNSLTRLRHAQRIGCQSVDGTFLAYGPRTNLPRLRSWLPALEQLELAL
jgi:hypothetical protein